jgi:superfamily II DNA or RNA helicase
VAEEDSFAWAHVPAQITRAFARALVGGKPTTEAAAELLSTRYPVPTAEFFKPDAIRRATVEYWLKGDPAALHWLHAELSPKLKHPPKHSGPLTPTMKRNDVKRLLDPKPHSGHRQSEAIREACARALLRSGGGADGDDPVLRALNRIPTSPGQALKPLPHQQRVIEALRDAYEGSGQRMVGMVVMPTGAGKTVTAVHWLLDDAVRYGAKVLWVTHRAELQHQTARTFVGSAALLADARKALTMRLVGGGYGPASTIVDPGHDVVVATIGALANQRQAVHQFLRDNRCVVVFDEAHHAVARTWRELLMDARDTTGDAVLGLTATPTRMAAEERRLLAQLFEREIASVTMSELVATGYLAEARCESVPTSVPVEDLAEAPDLEHLRQYGELSPRLANQLAENVSRNKIIVETYLRGPADGRQASYGQTLVFAVNVDHAHLLAAEFARHGVAAGALTGSWNALYTPEAPEAPTRDMDRAELLERYREREFPVLVNVQVMTEGVDVPGIESVFLARPTGSEVLMSQMVGRGLRGTKIGGTAHVYLVSFRDLWEAFPHWADPIALLPPPEEPIPAPEPTEHPPVRTGAPLSEAEWWALLQAAAAEARERFPATVGPSWYRVPVGFYTFEAELPIADGADPGEIETRHIDLYVYEHDRAGYQALSDAVDAGTATYGEAWLGDYFAEVPEPKPSLALLDALASYVTTHGAMPTWVPLEGRAEIDPEAIARELHTADARPSERDQRVEEAYQRNPSLVDAFYGGRDGLRDAVVDELARLEKGLPRTFDELRVPYVHGPDLRDYEYGEGAHDLVAILDRVRTDPALFPEPLPAPEGGIAWTKRGYASIWADYGWQRAPGIRVNLLLDSKTVDEPVLEFLVYHELLHHEDFLAGRPSPHDTGFRHREARHPAIVQANKWMDTFTDHYAPLRGTVVEGHAVPTERLVAVPGPDVTEPELNEFALTYNGYTIHHAVQAVAAIARAVEQEWTQGRLTTDPDRLRATLFHCQRQAHWSYGPAPLTERRLVAAVLEQLRRVCPDGVTSMEPI